MINFRPHRGGFEESMKLVQAFEDKDDLVRHIDSIAESFRVTGFPLPVNEDTVKIEYYCFDDRNKWDTYIVILEGFGPFGYTDGK